MQSDVIRVLVVDDSVVYRKIVSSVVSGLPGVELVGVAANGKIALQQISLLKPDVITLDLEMPELDGIGVLEELSKLSHRPCAIMVSAFTTAHARSTVKALSLGAFDFVVKPGHDTAEENAAALTRNLSTCLEAYRSGGQSGTDVTAKSTIARVPPKTTRIPRKSFADPRAVVIGVSTGGPAALARVIPALPSGLSVPVLIVQHMPPLFTKSLAEDLDRKSEIHVCEASDQMKPKAGNVYIAPGGSHMKIVTVAGEPTIRITDDPPEQSCRPSVDYLFRSACEVYGGALVGAILTGMGEDGTRGCRLLKERGSVVIAQNEATCVVYGMPRKVVEEELADAVVPLDAIASELTRHVCSEAIPCN